MEVYKIDLPKEEIISSRRNFVANDIFPCAIKPLDTGGVSENYIILFRVDQKLDDSVIYLQTMIKAQSTTEMGFLNMHPLNVYIMHKDKKLYDFYKGALGRIGDNIYATDLNMKKDGLYFKSYGIKGDSNIASVVDLYIKDSIFIKLKMFLNNLFNLSNQGTFSIFSTNIFNDIKFVDIKGIEYDGSTILSVDENSNNVLLNHYTFNIDDDTKFKANFISQISKNKKLLSKEIEPQKYEFLYEKDYIIYDIFFDADKIMYILYNTYSLDGKLKDAYALVLNEELYNKTNFVDDENVVYL